MRWFLLIVFIVPGMTVVAQQPDDQALAQKAVEAERRADFPGAVSAFQMLIRNGADSPQLRSNLGIAYYQMYDFAGALRELRVALAGSPNSVPANLFCGLSLLSLERARDGLLYLEKAHRAQPGDATSLLALARAHIALNHLSQARMFYQEALRLDDRNAEAWYGVGITDRALAETELKEAKHSALSADRSASVRKSEALLAASEQAMAKALLLDPSSLHAHMVLGESFRIAERYDLAILQYQEATRQSPGSAPAWGGLAASYCASGDDKAGLNAANRALALDSNDADTNTLIGAIYLRQGEYAQATSFAKRALQTQPGLSSARLILAKTYLAEHEPQKALTELQDAVKDDTVGNTYCLLATTLRELGRPGDAAAAMREYKQLHRAAVDSASK
ncbi:MAG: tetratricopeptide repeat protein [Acidobacteriota bacterium]|nr:tetratricopeptide repeat protein [Acidobacteriota bacterium]